VGVEVDLIVTVFINVPFEAAVNTVKILVPIVPPVRDVLAALN
jgi:hypothetical protein